MKTKGLLAFAYVLFTCCMYLLFYHGIEGQFLPTSRNLIQWDAVWYEIIKMRGYVFIPYKVCNMAFFPFFPIIWKFTGADSIGISLINFLIFLSSLLFIAVRKKITNIEFLFFLSIPMFVFCALPYSESLFFAFSLITLVGFEKKSSSLQFWGFLGASLTRSASMVAIPALIISTFLLDQNGSNKSKIKSVLWNILAIILGVAFSAVMQGGQTGKWFYFLHIQRYWKRHWVFPKFPFTTYAPEKMLGIDGLALLIGTIAGCYCLLWIYQFLRKQHQQLNSSQAVFFSALYIGGITILDVLFTFYRHDKTSIWSIGRHVLCTPFFVFFVVWWIKNTEVKLKIEWVIVPLIVLGFILSGITQYPKHILFVALFFTGLYILKYFPKYELSILFLCFLNILLQLEVFNRYINGGWIG